MRNSIFTSPAPTFPIFQSRVHTILRTNFFPNPESITSTYSVHLHTAYLNQISPAEFTSQLIDQLT